MIATNVLNTNFCSWPAFAENTYNAAFIILYNTKLISVDNRKY